jgi:hypothetical protein
MENLIFGAIGGFLYIVFPIMERVNKPKPETTDINLPLLLTIIFYPCLGALLAYMFKTTTLHAAFYTGITAPLTMKTLMNVPQKPYKRKDDKQ